MANPKPGPHISPPGRPSQFSHEPATDRDVESVVDIAADIFRDTLVPSDAPSSPARPGKAPGQVASETR